MGRRRKKKCETEDCKNIPDGKRKFCSTCRSRKSRGKDVVRYAFNVLRSNARRRRKECTITIQQFRKFCKKHNYIEEKGRHADGLTIDRIRQEEGYHIWNIQILKNKDNIKKHWAYTYFTKNTKTWVPVPGEGF
jgi:hypothetical protein